MEEEAKRARGRLWWGRGGFWVARNPKFWRQHQQGAGGPRRSAISGPGSDPPGNWLQSECVIWVRILLRLLPRVSSPLGLKQTRDKTCSGDAFEPPAPPKPLGPSPPLPSQPLPRMARSRDVQGNTFLLIVQSLTLYNCICLVRDNKTVGYNIPQLQGKQDWKISNEELLVKSQSSFTFVKQ